MRTQKTTLKRNKAINRPLNTTLTTLACMLAGLFPTYAQTASLYGCQTSYLSTDNANNCSASVGLNQKIDGNVYGGYSSKGSANNNRVNIAHGINVSDSVIGGHSSEKESTHNEVIIGNNVQIGTGKYGGGVDGGSGYLGARFNAVRIGENTTVTGSVIGGIDGGNIQAIRNNIEIDVSSNSVHIGNNSKITGSVTGGTGGKTASFNEVYIGNNVQIGHEIYYGNGSEIITGGSTAAKADFISTEASSNVVHIGDDVAVSMIYGGSAHAPFSSKNIVNNNRVTIGDRSNTFFVMAGNGWENSTVTKNTLTVGNDAKMGFAYGARSASGNVSENTVQIGQNLTAEGSIYGGDAYSAIAGEGHANNNTVIIGENATIKGVVKGGSALTNANNNNVIIRKGFNIASVVGGQALENTKVILPKNN